MKDFLVNVTDELYKALGPETHLRVGLVSYSDNARLEFTLDQGRTRRTIVSQINATAYMGGATNIADGIRIARTQIFGQPGDRSGVPNALILITDGQDTLNRNRTIPEATSAKQQGIFIATVGITQEVNVTRLREISSNDQVLTVDEFAQLENIVTSLARSACTATLPPTVSTTPGPTPTATPAPGKTIQTPAPTPILTPAPGKNNINTPAQVKKNIQTPAATQSPGKNNIQVPAPTPTPTLAQGKNNTQTPEPTL